MWISVGVLSGYLSKYLFSYILSPALIKAVRATNAHTQSDILMDIVSMLFVDMADFLLCFIFAIGLSYFTESTKPRLLLFVFGAIAINLYAQIERLIGYMEIYSELPAWTITPKLSAFVSLLLIIPLCSIAGNKLGAWIKMKRKID